MFRLQGRYVTLPPIHRAPTRAQSHLYSDDGDLRTLHNGEERTYSVKGISYTFVGDPTVKGGWPFHDILVDTVTGVDELGDKTHAYITVSADFSTICVVEASSRPRWKKRWIDTDEGKKHNYFADLADGRWFALPTPAPSPDPAS